MSLNTNLKQMQTKSNAQLDAQAGQRGSSQLHTKSVLALPVLILSKTIFELSLTFRSPEMLTSLAHSHLPCYVGNGYKNVSIYTVV